MAALRLRVGWGTIGAAFLFDSTVWKGVRSREKVKQKKKKKEKRRIKVETTTTFRIC